MRAFVVSGQRLGHGQEFRKAKIARTRFAPKHGTAKPGSCFRVEARMRKPSNPYKHGNTKAESCMSGKAQMRLPDSVGIRRCGFPQKHEYGNQHRQMNTIDCSPIGRNRMSSWFLKGNHRWRQSTH
ncbi:hypothetical protein F3J11_02485 [Burkholderia sp. Cy-647]|nr:hypothetical protein [Burkholderia sp. Tr-860]NIF61581.1 hypothetical protein [Burkholderia sp. Cy-647]NIF94842.1 hypothetical protein [Burkholderia sp. Ax-1720]